MNVDSWLIYDENNALDSLWGKLVFSVRSNKGMPEGYPNVSDKLQDLKPSYERWTNFIDGAYRGALHIRSK